MGRGRKGSGVEVRDRSIRIAFQWQGRRQRETLDLEPTPANIKYATRLADEIRQRVSHGTFDYAAYFPNSKTVRLAQIAPVTFGDLADLWLKSKGRLAAATRDQYATAVRFWNSLLGAGTPLNRLDHKTLASKIGGYPWPSAKTHNNYLIALRGIFALEYRGAAAQANPLIGIGNMKTVKSLPDPMTADERDRVLAELHKRRDERVYAYFVWQFFTGMRPEETIALRWSDVDFARQVVRVQRVRTFKGSERDGSKTHAERDVDLLPQAAQALAIMRPHTFMLRGADEDDSPDIFQNPNTGQAWHDERSQRDTFWRPTIKKLGIRWRKPYNTRHTYATAALMAGVPPAYIAAQLGHSVKMLLDKYARWIPGGDDGGARAMLAAAMSNSSPNCPQNGTGIPLSEGESGRHDWTRTNLSGNSTRGKRSSS